VGNHPNKRQCELPSIGERYRPYGRGDSTPRPSRWADQGDLVLLGFLDTEPFKGTSVRSFTEKELQEVYTVRAALESLAARLAATRMTEEDVRSLQDTLDRMIQAAQEQDEEEMVRLDNEFHETILQVSGNKLLHQVWQTVQFGYWTIVTARVSTYDLEELARRHESLLEALKSGEPQRAMAAMQCHIEDLGKPPRNLETTSGMA